MSAEAKNSILARIRSANGGATALAEAQWEWTSIERGYNSRSPLAADGVLELFKERLRDYDAVVQRCGAEEVASVLGGMLEHAGVRGLGVPAGLELSLPAGVEVHLADAMSATELNGLDAVLTACTAGIAETGTLVLQSVSGQGRRALSLVPDVHFCLVRAEDIVATVPEAVARLGATNSLPTTFISGPSATADIEMTRIKGVHGPRFLHVLIVQ